MTFNLRLPPALDTLARAQSQTLGISLNALICVALGEYLSKPVDVPKSRPVAPPAPLNVPLPAQVLTKAQRRALTAAARLSRKSAKGEERPLSSNRGVKS